MPEQRSWRAPRKKERELELDKLIAELDRSQSSGGGVILMEIDRGSLAEAMRLVAELGRRWASREKSLLLVDAHPARPFLACELIGAGGLGDLPLEDAAEPARALRRLAGAADRVILLVDSRDGEGMLDALIEASAFRLRLSDPELDEHLERLAARRASGRLRLLLILGIPLLVALIYFLLPDEAENVTLRMDPAPEKPLRALSDEADLPYFGGGADEAAVAADSLPSEIPSETASTPPDTADQNRIAEAPEAEIGKAVPLAVLRRGESRSDWNSALDHSGSFHVHVSSFRDSVRALMAQEQEGFGDLPFRIEPADVKGRTWYRVQVGCFPDLASAAAFRDSLLDQAGRDFCVIGIDPEP